MKKKKVISKYDLVAVQCRKLYCLWQDCPDNEADDSLFLDLTNNPDEDNNSMFIGNGKPYGKDWDLDDKDYKILFNRLMEWTTEEISSLKEAQRNKEEVIAYLVKKIIKHNSSNITKINCVIHDEEYDMEDWEDFKIADEVMINYFNNKTKANKSKRKGDA